MKLIYVGDPMCSWCYGLAPELESVIEAQKDKMQIEFVMGGLRPHFDKKMVEMKSFLSQHWKEVNHATNQPFNYAILDNEEMAYDTEPPCRAVVTVREIAPAQVSQFFKLTQEQFYVENLDMNLSSSYHQNLKKIGVNSEAFDKLFYSEEMKRRTARDFEIANNLGVRGFPTILLQIGEKVELVSNGYRKAEDINSIISKLISSKDKSGK